MASVSYEQFEQSYAQEYVSVYDPLTNRSDAMHWVPSDNGNEYVEEIGEV